MNGTYTLPATLASRIEAIVEQQGKTIDEVAARLWTDYLEEMEDGRDAEAIMGRIRRGEEETIPLEEITMQYGIEDDE